MKERKRGKVIRIGLARVLLFQLLAFTFIGYNSNAQGWTFTPQLRYTGDCEGAGAAAAQANAMLSALGNLSLPSKSMCESLRSQVLSIQVGGGDCVVGYTCTPCTGADISSPAGVTSAGTVSFVGQYTGEPLFSPHESLTRENYGIYYKQMQEILGFSSYLGSALMPVIMPKVPATGDKPLDDAYAKLAAEYDPYSQDASVVDLRESSLVVPLLHTAEDDIALEKWLNENDAELRNFLIQKYPELAGMDISDIIGSVKEVVSYYFDKGIDYISEVDWGLVNDKIDKKSLIQLGVDFLIDKKGERLEAVDKTLTQGIDDVLNNKAALKTTDEIISTVDDLLKTKKGLLTVNALKWGSNALSAFGVYDDAVTVYKDFQTDQTWTKKMYDVSVTVADAGLLVGGVVGAAGVTTGALVVSPAVAIGASVTVVAAKLYVDYGSAKKK